MKATNMKMKKYQKFTALILSVVMLISMLAVMPVSAADVNLTVKVDGEVMRFPDQKPVVKNNRTLVPVRFVAEELGYKVDWNQKEGAAVIDNGRIKLYVNTNKAVIDGKNVTLDVKTEVINERTMVPLRFVAENLNCTVDWVPTNSMILVNKRDANGKELSVFDRFIQTDLFWVVEFEQHYGKDLVLYSKTDYTEEQARSTEWKAWHISKSYYNADSATQALYKEHDCGIQLNTLDKKYVDQVADLLYILYPTQQSEAYDLLWLTVRERLWEREPDYSIPKPKWDSQNLEESLFASIEYQNMLQRSRQPGTYGVHYLDNRTVDMQRDIQCTTLIVSIFEEGYQPTYPGRTDLTEEEILSNMDSCYPWDLFYGDQSAQ